MMITCLLTCHECGCTKVPFKCRHKLPNESTLGWFERVVITSAKKAHRFASILIDDRDGVECMNLKVDILIPKESGDGAS